MEDQEPIRLNKYLSEAGFCSRREADRMIEQGRISVGGERALRRGCILSAVWTRIQKALF